MAKGAAGIYLRQLVTGDMTVDEPTQAVNMVLLGSNK